ncbi:MAG: hypothetical protein IJ927_06090 [Eubacterium sp.]|nr:hypothetical protein [Eubacterium sp.]
MANFSPSDINEAKRRVKEMQERARSYSQSVPNENEKQNDIPETKTGSDNNSPLGIFDFLSNLTSGDDGSKGIVLALILILAREKADNMLILALLYILL